MAWKCNICEGIVKFLDYEEIHTTDSDSRPVIEIYAIYECDHCGDPNHSLIRVIKEPQKPRIPFGLLR